TETVWAKLVAQVAPYDEATVAAICGCQTSDIGAVAKAMIENSRCASYTDGTAHPTTTLVTTPYSSGYRATTILYAMGITQHTCGSQNIKGFANLQTILGNMGRAGGGINALRGIHNVQGSTDMGLLNANIPAYSGNPTLMSAGHATAASNDVNAFGKYMDALWGSRMNGGTAAYDDAYTRTAWALPSGALNLQTKGFYNMTMRWFAPNYAANVVGGSGDDYVDGVAITAVAARRELVSAVYDLWPKGNGDDHITMLRKMIAGTTKAAFILGQNPAVTEPNQRVVREALAALDLMVVQDIFETETAACSRKAAGVTYLIPAAAHVEQAGSATNSGRVLQWRYQAIKPSGNSKTDLELLLRLAEALDTAGAFSHIESKWLASTATGGLGWLKGGTFAAGTNASGAYTGGTFVTVYDSLFGKQYGWTPSGATAFDAAAPVLPATKLNELPWPTPTVAGTPDPMVGAEYVAELIYQQMCTVVSNAGGGTIWIYHEAYNSAYGSSRLGGSYSAWTVQNRAKSRSKEDPYGTYGYHKWGYCWLVNRRVLYNNNAAPGVAPDSANEVPGDQNDGFQGPDKASRIFSTLNTDVMDYVNGNYRKHHNLKDKPSVGISTAPHVLSGRYPGHTEPYETPEPTLAATWGKNGTTGTSADLINTTDGKSPIGTVGTYPLVLTTIRCVEHFQGGPITRNNWFNVELEPEPWIELNSADARAAVPPIKDGDYVKVVTARTESLTNDKLEPYGSGFVARVGSGLSSGQKVAPGVVAIPWHWGEKGLSTGSRANDLTIDAWDANTQIPEYKACLCRIEKI
ncbi:MAG: molybdopterin-dependent oxidoreductase, partial [Actinomycetes bacterium]